MKKKRQGAFGSKILNVIVITGLLLLATAVYFYLRYRDPGAKASRQRVRVMTYNVDHLVATKEAAEQKMRILSDYLVANDIDIAALQEMDNGRAITSNDFAAMLAQNMAERGRPVEIYEREYRDGDQSFRSIIVTRYAGEPWAYEEFHLTPSFEPGKPNDSNRWMPTVLINSPIGQIRVGSVHVGSEAYVCESLETVGRVMTYHFYNDPNIVIMGDFNNLSCNTGWNNLLSNVAKLSNQSGQDHILATKPNIFQVFRTSSDTGYHGSRHVPVIADLTLVDSEEDIEPVPQPIAGDPAIPTVTPYGGACVSQQKSGDYDCSGNVDMTDFTNWLSDFLEGKSTLTFLEYWRRVYY